MGTAPKRQCLPRTARTPSQPRERSGAPSSAFAPEGNRAKVATRTLAAG